MGPLSPRLKPPRLAALDGGRCSRPSRIVACSTGERPSQRGKMECRTTVAPSLLTGIGPSDGPGTEPEPETGTVRTGFPGTKIGTGTVGTVFQEPQPEPCHPLNCTDMHRQSSPQRNRRNRKLEPLEPFHGSMREA